MNAIVFQLKRGHLASMKACRWLIRVVKDMTPARFDIMLLLRRASFTRLEKRRDAQLNGCFMGQSRIVRELGLHKSTVSEALKRLEELGWIVRDREFGARRNKLVQMTELGLARTWEACKMLYRAKVLKRPVDEMVRHLEPKGPFNAAFEKVWETINQLARWFGDTSTTTLYDRQIAYEIPPFSEWEWRTARMFGPEAGPRLPDFVLAFLATRE